MQVIFHSGYADIENINAVIEVGRYAIHIEGGGTIDENDIQYLKNCTFEHKGNHLADNFSSWDSDNALGFGNSSGQITIAYGCKFIARKQPITYHTNVGYANTTIFKEHYCEKITTQKTYTDSLSKKKLAMNISELGSNQKHLVEMIGCKISDGITVGGSFYTNCKFSRKESLSL